MAVDFNGTTSKAEHTTATGLDQATFTVCFWAYVDSLGEGTAGRVCSIPENGTSPRIYLQATDELRFLYNFSTTSGTWEFPMTHGAWHPVSITYDRGATTNNPTARVDYASATVTTITTPVGTASAPGTGYCVGNNTGQTATFDGGIAAFQFFSGILSAADQDKALKDPGSVTTNLKLDLRFDTSTDGDDRSTANQDATLTAIGARTPDLFFTKLASTLADATMSASGDVSSGVTSTFASTLANATMAATGAEAFPSTFASTLANATLAATGAEAFPSTFASTLANATLAATGAEAFPSTFASTLANATLAASGNVVSPVTSTFASTLANATLAASGSIGGIISRKNRRRGKTILRPENWFEIPPEKIHDYGNVPKLVLAARDSGPRFIETLDALMARRSSLDDAIYDVREFRKLARAYKADRIDRSEEELLLL